VKVDRNEAAVERIDPEAEFFKRRRTEQGLRGGRAHEDRRRRAAALAFHVHLCHRPFLDPAVGEHDPLTAQRLTSQRLEHRLRHDGVGGTWIDQRFHGSRCSAVTGVKYQIDPELSHRFVPATIVPRRF